MPLRAIPLSFGSRRQKRQIMNWRETSRRTHASEHIGGGGQRFGHRSRPFSPCEKMLMLSYIFCFSYFCSVAPISLSILSFIFIRLRHFSVFDFIYLLYARYPLSFRLFFFLNCISFCFVYSLPLKVC